MVNKLKEMDMTGRKIKLYKSNLVLIDKPNNIYVSCHQKYKDGLSFAAEISCI